jgi:hypothetical protein
MVNECKDIYSHIQIPDKLNCDSNVSKDYRKAVAKSFRCTCSMPRRVLNPLGSGLRRSVTVRATARSAVFGAGFVVDAVAVQSSPRTRRFDGD